MILVVLAAVAGVVVGVASRRLVLAETGAPISSGALGALTGALAAGADPLFIGVASGLVVLALAGGFVAWRYRGELRRLLRTIRGV